jgi:hypothetical protein
MNTREQYLRRINLDSFLGSYVFLFALSVYAIMLPQIQNTDFALQ